MRFTSVRARLTLWSMGVQALILAVMGTTLWYVMHANLLASVDRGMERRGHAIARLVTGPNFRFRDSFRRRDPRLPDPGAAPPKPDTADTTPAIRRRPVLLNLHGQGWLPGSTDKSWDARSFALSANGREAFTIVKVQKEPLRVYSFPLRREGAIVGVGQIAESLQEVNHELASLTQALLTLIPLALLVTGLSGAFQTDRMLRPVRRITRMAAHIGAADLSERLPVAGEDEFARLARTFNGMLARLGHAFEQQQRFTADASHELRTPLTAIKAHTSLALDGEKTPEEYRIALRGTDRAATLMSQIIQDLLLLTRLDAGQPDLNAGPVSLREVIETAAEMLVGCDHAPIKCADIPPEMLVLGDRGQLVRLFTNLLDNAIRHTPPEGCIILYARNTGPGIKVTVADTGSGIAPEHLPHIRERFYRVDAARSRKRGGTGLGLAICQGIVEAHGGKMEIDSELGRGTTVQVTLPTKDTA